MGTLIPEDYPLRELVNEAERRVVTAFRDGLNDGWLVIPDVALRERDRDYQLDVVLIHQAFGVVDIEIKGHAPEIRDGLWWAHGQRMQPQPIAQAQSNAYALRARSFVTSIPSCSTSRSTTASHSRMPPMSTAPSLRGPSGFRSSLPPTWRNPATRSNG